MSAYWGIEDADTKLLSCYSLIPFVAASHTAHLAADIGFIRKSMRGA